MSQLDKETDKGSIPKKRRRTTAAQMHGEKLVRFQVQILQSRAQRLEIAMAKGGLCTRRELFDYAFSFLEWVVNEEKELGNASGARDPAGNFHPLEMPPVTNLRLRKKQPAPLL